VFFEWDIEELLPERGSTRSDALHGEKPQGSEDSSLDFSDSHLSATSRSIKFRFNQRLKFRLLVLREAATAIASGPPARDQLFKPLLLRPAEEGVRPQALDDHNHPRFVFSQLSSQGIKRFARRPSHRFPLSC
jgi:hypothetical protein